MDIFIIIVLGIAAFGLFFYILIRSTFKKDAKKYLPEFFNEIENKVKEMDDKISTYQADFTCGHYNSSMITKNIEPYVKKDVEKVLPEHTHKIVIDYDLNKLLFCEFIPQFKLDTKNSKHINSVDVNFIEENLKDLIKYELVIKAGKAEGINTSVSSASLSNNSVLGGSIGSSTMHQTTNGISVIMVFKDKKEIDMPFVSVKGAYLDAEWVQERLKEARSLCNVLETYMEENKKDSSKNSTIKDEPVVGKKEKLKELKELLDDGLISQAEFDKEKAKILNN